MPVAAIGVGLQALRAMRCSHLPLPMQLSRRRLPLPMQLSRRRLPLPMQLSCSRLPLPMQLGRCPLPELQPPP